MAPQQPCPVREISRFVIRPPQSPGVTGHPARCELSAWELPMLSAHYNQKGMLFSVPSVSQYIDHIVDRLKASLSAALVHFYPLAGRLVTERDFDVPTSFVTHVDCNDRGAEFILAVAEATSVADVLKPLYTPPFLWHFFPLDLAVNHDGHTNPLLVVQVTELADGFFLGCSFNHALGDGTSFWHLLSVWSEICRGVQHISRPPVHDRWFIDGSTPPIKHPFNNPDEFVERFRPPDLLPERLFRFPSTSLIQLKARANEESKSSITISTFQALSALVWRSITRARRLRETQKMFCFLAIDNRSRLRPPLSPDHFGNSINSIVTTATAGELLGNNIGWAAALLNQAIAAHTDAVIGEMVESWMRSPEVCEFPSDTRSVVRFGSSPRFDVYGCEFGWGKAVAVRSGRANKFYGKITSYPGREGDGSVDMEICLSPETMSALESDMEFMSHVSLHFDTR